MNRKTVTQDKPKGRGGKRPGAGRKESGKVKMTVHVTPETRVALGDKPGEVIDALFRKP